LRVLLESLIGKSDRLLSLRFFNSKICFSLTRERKFYHKTNS